MTMTPTPVASAATNASPPPPPPPIAQVAEPAPARGAADRTERWSFDDLEQEGMELPPSYYEAVGLHDTE